MVAIGDEISKEVSLTGTGEASWLDVLALFAPLAVELFGQDTKVLAAECDLLKPVNRPARLSVALKMVDKGGNGRLLWGRGLGHLEDGGAFAVVSMRILMPASTEDHFGTTSVPTQPPLA